MKNRLERCLFSPRRTWTSTGDQGRVLMKQGASGELLDFIQSFILFMGNWFFHQNASCGLTKRIHGGKRRKPQGLPPYHRLLTDPWVILLEMFLGSSVRVQLRHGWQLWKQGWKLHRPTCVLFMTSRVALPQELLSGKMKIGRREESHVCRTSVSFRDILFLFLSIKEAKTFSPFLRTSDVAHLLIPLLPGGGGFALTAC